MRRLLVAGVVLVAGLALAEPQEGPGAEHAQGVDEKEVSVADYILHHVSDSNEYELEVPILDKYNKTYLLPQLFVPMPWGGRSCEPLAGAEAHGDHGVARPSLAQGCLDLSITKHTLFMWIAAGLLVLLMLTVPNRDKRQLVPRGTWANLFEAMILFVRDELAIKNIGTKYGAKYTPFLLTIFFFILFMNLLGLLPWSATATANLAVTLGLAVCVFLVTQFASIRAAGFKAYLAHLTGGVHWALWPIMIPVEILGLFTKPFALTVRLFANMLAGHIVIFFLLGLIFILKNAALAFMSVPFAMGIYLLELFVAFVQAYVFTMLSALFIGMGVAVAHHHEEHGHEAHGHGH
ncbi:MAG: F0F1 ATP synthase subunit A [Myxococcaceae bacterium]|nr:F0F1 ATP synthase subunit A [Myxococcaceae bacterium]